IFEGNNVFPCNSHEASSEENDGIDYSHDPFVLPFTIDLKFFMEGQVGPVGSSLIPSLSGSSNGTKADRVPEHDRSMPFVVLLVCEGGTLLIIELGNRVEPIGITSDQRGSSKQIGVLRHAVRLGVGAGIVDD